MNKTESSQSSPKRAFCTFCMGIYDRRRIGSHLLRCTARLDDAACIPEDRRPLPAAFLLMVTVEGRSEAWACLEAYGTVRFADLERFVRLKWFSQYRNPGVFSWPTLKGGKQPSGNDQPEPSACLDKILKVKDRVCITLADRIHTLRLAVEVVGRLPTAIAHMPVDVVAFSPEGPLTGFTARVG